LLSSSKAFTSLTLALILLFADATAATSPAIANKESEQYLAAKSIADASLKNINEIKPAKVVSAPTVSNKYKKALGQNIKKTISFWYEYVGQIDFTLVVFTEKDLLWLEKTKKYFGGDFSIDDQMAEVTNTCTWAIATKTKNDEPIIYLCTSSSGFSYEELQTFPHEYYHLVQFYTNPGGSTPAAPCWILEGSATYFGTAIGFFEKQKSYKTFSRNFISSLLDHSSLGIEKAKKIIKGKNSNQTIKHIILPSEKLQWESSGSCYSAASYYVGGFITEYLIIKYGVEKFIELSLIEYASVNWKTEFERIYGFSVDKLYLSVVPYITSQTKL
jgi:hypothetical protein